MKKLFKDDNLQKVFEEKGYVIVPFYDNSIVNELSVFFEELKDKHEILAPVHSTSDTDNPELIRQVDKKIREVSQKKVDEMFFESKIFLCNYLVKEPGEDSAITPHHDWTFVDETRFASVSVWCPLVDVDEKNGYLSVLPGSHNFIETLRVSPDYPFAFNEVTDIIEKYMVTEPMKAGEALIYNHALIHASSPNMSDKPRPVVIVGVMPEEADLLLYYHPPGPGRRKVEKFIVDTDFFYRYKKHSRPKAGKSMGMSEYNFKTLPRAEFLRLVNDETPPEKPHTKSLIEKVLNLFK